MDDKTAEITENMIRWAQSRLGETGYSGWCLSFIEDALEIANGIEVFGGDCPRYIGWVRVERVMAQKSDR